MLGVLSTLLGFTTFAHGQDLSLRPSQTISEHSPTNCNGCVAYVSLWLKAEAAFSSDLTTNLDVRTHHSTLLGRFWLDQSTRILGDDLASLTISPILNATPTGIPLITASPFLVASSYVIGTKVPSGSLCKTKLLGRDVLGLWPTGNAVVAPEHPIDSTDALDVDELLSQARQLETLLADSAQLLHVCRFMTQTTMATITRYPSPAPLERRSNNSSLGTGQTLPASIPLTGFSTGQIVGIVFGAIAVAVLFIMVLYFFWRRTSATGKAKRQRTFRLNAEKSKAGQRKDKQQQFDDEISRTLDPVKYRGSPLTLGTEVDTSAKKFDQAQDTNAYKSSADEELAGNPAASRFRSRITGSQVLGLNLVYDPGASADCEVVLVHGFFESSSSTWAHDTGVFWPSDFLPKKMPLARIWCYDYTTQASNGTSYKTTRDCAKELLTQFLSAHNEMQRTLLPLVIVCHHTAGLMVAEAIVESSFSSSPLFDAFRNVPISGIVFLSTPFNRIPITSTSWWQYYVFYDLNIWTSNVLCRFILKRVSPNRWALATLKAEFRASAPLNIISFYDTESFRHGHPLCDESACVLGLPEEVSVPGSSLSSGAAFQFSSDFDYLKVSTAIESCVYGFQFVDRNRPSKFSTFQAPTMPTVKVPDRKSDIIMVPSLQSRSLPDLTISTGKPMTSAGMTAVQTGPTSSFLRMPDGLEASKAFLRATALDAPAALPIQFQLGAGAIAGAGVIAGTIIGSVNAHSARVAAKANVRSAKAAEESARAATANVLLQEEKLSFDMRKEKEENGSKDKIADECAPGPSNSGNLVAPTALKVLPGSARRPTSKAKPQPDLTEKEKSNLINTRRQLGLEAADRIGSVQKPVKLQWTRPSTLKSEDYRTPGNLQRLRKTLPWGEESKPQATFITKGREHATDEELNGKADGKANGDGDGNTAEDGAWKSEKPGIFQQMIDTFWRSRSKSLPTSSQKGKGRATNHGEDSTESLELDLVDVDAAAINQDTLDVHDNNTRPLADQSDAMLRTDSNPLASDSKGSQQVSSAGGVHSLANGRTNESSVGDAMAATSDSHQQAGLGNDVIRKSDSPVAKAVTGKATTTSNPSENSLQQVVEPSQQTSVLRAKTTGTTADTTKDPVQDAQVAESHKTTASPPVVSRSKSKDDQGGAAK